MIPRLEYGVSYSKSFEVALFSISSLTVLGATLVAPSLPSIQEHFASVPHIAFLSRLVLTLPALFIMISAPIAGSLIGRFGRLKILYPSMLLWSVFGISGYFLENIEWILLFRALFGIASGFVMTCISVLISDYYTQEVPRQKALSKQNFFSAFGGAIFLILGGVLSEIDWRMPFLVYALGFLVFLGARAKLFEPKNTLKDSLGEQKFSFMNFLGIYLVTFVSMSLFYFVPTQLPYYLHTHFGVGGSIVGASIASVSIFSALFSFLYPRFRKRLAINQIYALSFFVLSCGFFLLYLENYYLLILVFLAFGFSWGVTLVNHYSWLFSIASEGEKARAVGFLSSFLFLGQFLSAFWIEGLVSFFGLKYMILFIGTFSLTLWIVFLVLFYKKGR